MVSAYLSVANAAKITNQLFSFYIKLNPMSQPNVFHSTVGLNYGDSSIDKIPFGTCQFGVPVNDLLHPEATSATSYNMIVYLGSLRCTFTLRNHNGASILGHKHPSCKEKGALPSINKKSHVKKNLEKAGKGGVKSKIIATTQLGVGTTTLIRRAYDISKKE
ncbi:hypothetical protein HAX54_043145 [Datura stramonium]|uniref:Uncharacterized protein n=1 Tax=Datura stramonium TaxID=4076 RepID=A0ABS8SN58_DATST|nr:hypothetical protein [Datura stramonium]